MVFNVTCILNGHICIQRILRALKQIPVALDHYQPITHMCRFITHSNFVVVFEFTIRQQEKQRQSALSLSHSHFTLFYQVVWRRIRHSILDSGSSLHPALCSESPANQVHPRGPSTCRGSPEHPCQSPGHLP